MNTVDQKKTIPHKS